MKTTFTLLLFCIPSFLLAQVVDTAAIERQVDSLIQVSRELTGEREFDRALEVNAEAERLALEAFGRESAAYGSCCFNRGRVLHFKRDYPEAEKWYIDAMAIREKVHGKEHPLYAWCLNNLGNWNREKGNFDKAEAYHLEALSIREMVHGKEHPDYLASLINIGALYKDMGIYNKSENYLLNALPISEKLYGKVHPHYAACLTNLAALYIDLSKYEDAEPYFLEALSIEEKIKGRESLDYATWLSNLAGFYMATSNYEIAEQLLLDALSIINKIDKNIVHDSGTLYNLALLYLYMGEYEKSEHIFLEIKLRIKETTGEEYPDYLDILNNLAIIYAKTGNYSKSESLFLESNFLKEKMYGKEHHTYAAGLGNLGLLYCNINNFEKAELLFLDAIAIEEKANGKKHPSYASSLENLGVLYAYMGKNKDAVLYFQKAKKIREEVLGKMNPDYARSLFNIAILYQNNSNYLQAESLHVEALSIREKTLDKTHPDYASSLQNLANLYQTMGNYKKSEPLYTELAQLNHSYLSRALRHLSVRELENYVQTFTESQSQTLSFAQLPQNRNSDIVQSCYNNALFYKGFLLDAAGQVKRLALADSSTTARFNLLKSYGRRLSRENDKPIAERDSASIAELEEKANDLEKELARTVAGYGEAMRQVKWQEVQQNLKEGEAAVEFVHYRYYGKEKTDSVIYAALLLLPGAEQPVFIPLFEERELTQLIPDRRMRARDFVGELYTPDLYRLIWQPLESHLEGVRTVHFSPSGLLHRISFPAIPAGGALLSDRYDLQYMSSTRNLVTRKKGKGAVPVTALVYGGIEYEPDTVTLRLVAKADSLAKMQQEVVAVETGVPDGEPAVGDAGIATPVKSVELPYVLKEAMKRSPELAERKWGPLDTTLVEMQRLERFFKSRHLFTMTLHGYDADEESFKAIGEHFPPPDILHIATHGFFFPDEPDMAMSWGEGADNLRQSANPMRRSGIVLAGANLAWKQGITIEGRQDGILTAEEISLQNLSGTKLVVLSACETGLGDIHGSEGVYGLQRAFKQAGAENLLLTLWSIPDSKETVDFMEVFYEKWLGGELSIREAFNETQREIRAQYPEPYFWAGFILID